MSDLIDRGMVLDKLREAENHAFGSFYKGLIKAHNIIADTPSAKPQPKRGKWIKKHRHYGGFRSYTGFDAMGEQHTITVDERVEYDDLYCSECGARSADNFLNFCPNCGADMRGEQDG